MCTSYFVKWRLVCLDNCYLATLTCFLGLVGVQVNLVQPENELLGPPSHDFTVFGINLPFLTVFCRNRTLSSSSCEDVPL